MLLAYYIVINHSKWYHGVTSDSLNHENQQGGSGVILKFPAHRYGWVGGNK